MSKSMSTGKYLLVGLANQEGLALPKWKREDIRVSAEPPSVDFLQQWCSQLSQCSSVPWCPLRDLPRSVLWSWCSRSCQPPKGIALSTSTKQIWWTPPSSASPRQTVLMNSAQHLQLFPDILRNYLRLGLSASGAERELGGYRGFQTSSWWSRG